MIGNKEIKSSQRKNLNAKTKVKFRRPGTQGPASSRTQHTCFAAAQCNGALARAWQGQRCFCGPASGRQEVGPSSDRWLRGSDLRLSRRTPTLLRIDELAQEIRRKTGAEVAVVTVKRIKGAAEDRQEIKRFTTDARPKRICSHSCATRQPEA